VVEGEFTFVGRTIGGVGTFTGNWLFVRGPFVAGTPAETGKPAPGVVGTSVEYGGGVTRPAAPGPGTYEPAGN
jgi:hypothetical protein